MNAGTSQVRMVADVGGTNTRIALYDPAAGEFRALGTFINCEFTHFEDVVDAWLQALDETPPALACIAVAAPPSGDRVSMININWSFSCSEVAARFGFRQFRCLNDFEGNAHALPYLQAADLHCLHSGEPARADADVARVLATVGPGTGLGGAILHSARDTVFTRACEPGHMGLSPASEREQELFRLLLQRFGNVYAELLVSGPGLRRLYETLAEIDGAVAATWTPAEISREALAGRDPLCVEALSGFCELLGSVCGDFILANGAYDGLYLAGGILPRMIPFLTASNFHRRLCAKGAMREHLQRLPVYAITSPQPGLTGAAHAPL